MRPIPVLLAVMCCCTFTIAGPHSPSRRSLDAHIGLVLRDDNGAEDSLELRNDADEGAVIPSPKGNWKRNLLR